MSSEWFVSRAALVSEIAGRSVALVGSGPGVLDNPPGLVDSHDVVVRVNNYRLFPATGFRTDIFYSYFGGAIKKTADELRRDGVRLCVCKCPDAQFMESKWHRQRGKMNGVDFRMIYENRREWWFCPTLIPSVDEFMGTFEMLRGHVPTTGFAALLAVLSNSPSHTYMTGFDFFSSRIHNVNEKWHPGKRDDPIGHAPELERDWLRNFRRCNPQAISMDKALTKIMER
jgi:hypothetical protein